MRHTSASLRAALNDELHEIRLGDPGLQDASTTRLCRLLLKQQRQGGSARANAKHQAAVKWLQKETVSMRSLDYKLGYLRSKLLLREGEIQAAFGEVDELGGVGAHDHEPEPEPQLAAATSSGAGGGSAAAEARDIRRRARFRSGAVLALRLSPPVAPEYQQASTLRLCAVTET